MGVTSDGVAAARSNHDLAAILTEFADIATTTLSVDRLLPALARLARKVVSYELFVVLLKAHGTPYFHVCFATGYGERRLRNRRVRTGQGITGVAAATRKTVVVNDVRRDARYIPAVDGILSEMAVPLVARGRVIGVIDFESTKVNAFGNRGRSLLRLIGGRIALAVDNASMHERTAAWNRTLKSLIKISLRQLKMPGYMNRWQAMRRVLLPILRVPERSSRACSLRFPTFPALKWVLPTFPRLP